MRSAGVIGLGLIGGSLARDLARSGVRVIGHDEDPATLRRALDSGVLAAPLGAGLDRVADVDCLVVAVPVDRAADVLRAAAPLLGRASLVTDVGSTKRSIVAAAIGLGIGEKFVGSHPFTGSHAAGWAAARDGLFAGARVFLCPTGESGQATIDQARSLWALCGATAEIIDAAEHDRLLAWSSHLPQFLSSALAIAMSDADVTYADAGPAAREMLRLAASDTRVWAAIGLDNADNLTAALLRCEQVLSSLRSAIDGSDGEPLSRLLRAANRFTTGG